MSMTEAVTMRQRILDAATHLFTISGYSAISMREIAEACNISKAALYYHFTAKESLFLAILTEYLTEMGEIIANCQTAFPTARGQLVGFMQAIFAQPVERRAIIRLANQEMSNLSAQTRASFDHLYQEQFIGRLAQILEEGMQRGELRRAEPHLAVWVFLGMMYPFFYPGLEHREHFDEAIQLMINIFFDGISAHD